jgi:hypothetical protein
MTGLLTGHIFKLGLVNNPECDRCKQALKQPHILADYEAWATLRIQLRVSSFYKTR